MSCTTYTNGFRRTALAAVAALLLPAGYIQAQQTGGIDRAPSAAAAQIADIFSQVGDQIYEDCIFELSQEQLDVQQALIQAYVAQGASSAVARQLAVKQIQPPKLSADCEQVRRQPHGRALALGDDAVGREKAEEAEGRGGTQGCARTGSGTRGGGAGRSPSPTSKSCRSGTARPNVDFVTISLNGFKRKLTGGEICNPYEDVVHEVPASLRAASASATRSGPAVCSSSPTTRRRTARPSPGRSPAATCAATIPIPIALPLGPSVRCRRENIPSPRRPERRVSWGPKTKRNVAGIWLRKLWNKERFSKAQTKAILARGNIAIHVRLKGEMSEACLGLEPKGWAYVAGLIKDGRATGVNVYIDEPHPQVAEAPPVVVGSSFSLTSLFK